ncbi:YheC/YheD family protein [Paenibacillus pinistramenti]|uniref:YheC/YheD family protein n=1 Tax=Paenibacillus pinistramenti TaxID=1768003 RepID=UPI001109D73B|nr:YheC/YheD family protein [Paenibacillus pinistramenti]
MDPDYVGILLNALPQGSFQSGRVSQESLSVYEEAAALYGLKPCYLQLKDISSTGKKSLVYVMNETGVSRIQIPTPKVIHNRAIYKSRAAARKIAALQSRGIVIFNTNTRYRKDRIHSLLARHPVLSRHQPHTLPATPANIRSMMRLYADLLLKPVSSSVGLGIMRLYRGPSGWVLTRRSPKTRTAGRKWVTIPLGSPKGFLPGWLIQRLRRTPYMIQERLSLAEIDGRPIDLRVTVQRGLDGKWGVTGMFAKMSEPGGFLTNIAQGGSAYPAEYLLHAALPPGMAERLTVECRALALEVARHLSSRLSLLADLGIDIGVTSFGEVYFIECNGRDQRYGFREAGMISTWIETYRKPMAFAKYLLTKQV